MNIGIDASRALRPIKTGTEWYSVEIIRHLVYGDNKNNYILYSQTPPAAPLLDLPKNVSWKIMPFPRGWTLFRLSLEMRKHPPDVLFIPAHTLPLRPPKKSVVMIHDLGFKHYPELYPSRQKIYHNFVVNFVAKHASHIITPSEFVRQDVIKSLGVKPENITTVHHGYDSNLYQPRPDLSHKSAQFKPYIFFIGRLETKKNVAGLIEAFQILRHQNPDIKPKLVLAGKPSHGYDKIKQFKENLIELGPDIIELGYTPEEEIPIWMSNADVFAFPTFFEGFGFPVIQAMACGTPVVASNTTCIPEIAGNAALLVNPQDPQAIAEAMKNVLTDPNVSKGLVAKGLTQVKQFSWQISALKTLEILEKVGNSQ